MRENLNRKAKIKRKIIFPIKHTAVDSNRKIKARSTSSEKYYVVFDGINI